MTSRFGQLFARTGFRLILRQFGETITYYPKTGMWGIDACEGVEMQAKVDRQGIASVPEMQGFPTDSFVVSILDDDTYGRLVSDIDETGDAIELAPDIGLDPIRKQVVQIMASEPGVVRLLVR